MLYDDYEKELKAALESLPSDRSRENFQKLMSEMQVDPSVLITLKGHLLFEERLTAAIEKYVFHPEHLDARFTFAHKVSLARSMSTDEHNNGMWDVVLKINSLRNAFAHKLDSSARKKAVAALQTAFTREMGKMDDFEREHEHLMILSAVSACLGFIEAFEQEVERFREWVNRLDRFVNPHRHAKPAVTGDLGSESSEVDEEEE